MTFKDLKPIPKQTSLKPYKALIAFLAVLFALGALVVFNAKPVPNSVSETTVAEQTEGENNG